MHCVPRKVDIVQIQDFHPITATFYQKFKSGHVAWLRSLCSESYMLRGLNNNRSHTAIILIQQKFNRCKLERDHAKFNKPALEYSIKVTMTGDKE